MPLKYGFHLVQIGRGRPSFCKGCIHIVVDQHQEPNLPRKVQKLVQSLILKASDPAGYFRRYELFVDAELPDT